MSKEELPTVPRNQEQYDTLVIGGGYAGLSAMQTLTEGKVNALLCEARNDTGGRTILSRKESPAIAERGAFFVYTNDMKDRLEKAGVEVTEFLHDAFYVVNDEKKIVPAGADGGPAGLARIVAAEILTYTKNISYDDFFRTSKTFSRLSVKDKKAVYALFEADLAGPLSDVGISSAIHDAQTVGDNSNDFFGICTKGGLSTLAKNMSSTIPAEAKRTGTNVRNIRIDRDELAFGLGKKADGNSEELRAKSGILTAPLTAIDGMTFTDRDGTEKPLRKAMRPGVQYALNMIGSGSVVKIGLKIKKPLIEGKQMVHIAVPPPDEGSIRCASVRALPLPDYGSEEKAEGQMLLMYLGGTQATDFITFCNELDVREGENKLEKIKTTAIAYLQEHLGIDPKLITEDAIDISGWSPEKGDRTAYSYIKADGRSTAYNPRAVFKESVLPKGMPPLYLAGEAYSETGATLTTGAFDSGALAARNITKSSI